MHPKIHPPLPSQIHRPVRVDVLGQVGQQILLPRLAEHQPLQRQNLLEPLQLAGLAAEGQHGHPTLDIGAALHLVDPVRHYLGRWCPRAYTSQRA